MIGKKVSTADKIMHAIIWGLPYPQYPDFKKQFEERKNNQKKHETNNK